MIPVIIFVFGAIYGSFINVIIFRLPKNLSIILPKSFCFHCKTPIPMYRNIPIVSFLIQNGKCANCNCKISIQYPIIELITGFIFLLSYFFIFPGNQIESLFFAITSGLLVSIALIDHKYFIIPLSLILSIIIINIPFIVWLSSEYITYHIYGAIVGLGYLSIVFVLTWLLVKKQPMGFGDLQLIIILGMWLGPVKILLTIFFASILGILYWALLFALKKQNKNVKLPFGTFLCCAGIIMYLIPVWNPYS